MVRVAGVSRPSRRERTTIEGSKSSAGDQRHGPRPRHPDAHGRDRRSYLGANAHVKAEEIPAIIRSVRVALAEDAAPPSATEESFLKADKRAVTKSIIPNALISFIDNKPYKTLKRHLGRHGLDMGSYRERYGLPSDYPSVAPSYSATRSEMAKKLGLGAQRRGQGKAAGGQAAAPAAAKGRRKASAE